MKIIHSNQNYNMKKMFCVKVLGQEIRNFGNAKFRLFSFQRKLVSIFLLKRLAIHGEFL